MVAQPQPPTDLRAIDIDTSDDDRDADADRRVTGQSFLRETWFLALLLVVGAALFAVGVSVERRGGDDHTQASATATTVHNEASETGGEGRTEAGSEATSNSEGTSIESGEHSESSEKILGINTESTGLVAVAVAVSLALAVLVLVRPRRPVFLAVAGLVVLFAAFDIVEAIHQINNRRAGVAAIAVALILIHAVAALLSMQHKDPSAVVA